MKTLKYISVLVFAISANLGVAQDGMKLLDVEKVNSTLNSAAEESFPLVSPDGKLYFVRTLFDANTGGNKAGQDIWFAERSGDEWSTPSNDLHRLNNRFNNAVVGIADSGRVLYLNGTYSSKPEYQTGVSSTEYRNGKWSRPKELRIRGFDPYGNYVTYYVDADHGIMLLSFSNRKTPEDENIYVSFLKKGRVWGKPETLGDIINTEGSEFSPFISSDGKRIYFSSDGHSGQGNADVFVSDRLDDTWLNWSKPTNLGPEINSDGFEAYYTQQGLEAYFSSNRDNSLTDIYRARFAPVDRDRTPMPSGEDEMRKERLFALKGFLDIKNPERVGFVRVVDQAGNTVQRVKPNSDGSFLIAGLEKFKTYNLDLDGQEKEIEDVEIFFINQNGNRVYLNEGLTKGKYPFETLERDIRAVMVAEVSDNSQLNTASFVVENAFESVKGSQVYLYDANRIEQELVEVTIEGEFRFKRMLPGTIYQFDFENGTDIIRSKVFLVEGGSRYPVSGNILKGALFKKMNGMLIELDPNSEEGRFAYDKLRSIEKNLSASDISDQDLDATTFGFEYGQLPPEGTKVTLLDEDGNIVGEALTDAEGLFKFKKLDPDKKYSMKLENLGDLGAGLSMYLVDDDGLQVPLNNNIAAGQSFAGSAVVPTEATEEEDEFSFNYSALPPAGSKIYLTDENDNVIDSSYVDADGNFKFRKLRSEKAYRMKLADDLDQSQGLSMFVVDASGAEHKLSTKDEEGDAISAVDPSTVINKPNFDKFCFEKLPRSGSMVYLTDLDGNIIDSAYVDSKGNFRFKKLDPTKSYLFKVDDEDFDTDGSNLFAVDQGQKRKLVKLPGSYALNEIDRKSVEDVAFDESKFQIEFEGEIPASAQAYLYDEETNEIVDSVDIAADGSFVFKKLKSDRKLKIKFDEELDNGNLRYFAIDEVAVTPQPLAMEQTAPLKAQETIEKVEKSEPILVKPESEWSVYFEFNKFLLTPDQIEELYESTIKSLKQDEAMNIYLEGHTDNVGSDEVNYRMSQLRLSSVVYHLEINGIDESRMTITPKGESSPAYDNSTEEGRAKNRRVDISIQK